MAVASLPVKALLGSAVASGLQACLKQLLAEKSVPFETIGGSSFSLINEPSNSKVLITSQV